jgi:hypothetical protein
VSFVRHDVTSEAYWARAVEAAQKLGGLHGLVNNAGIYQPAALMETDDALWQRHIRTNRLGGRAVERDLPALAVDRHHGDARSERAELRAGLDSLRAGAFGLVAHGLALPAGAPPLPATRASPMSLPAFRLCSGLIALEALWLLGRPPRRLAVVLHYEYRWPACCGAEEGGRLQRAWDGWRGGSDAGGGRLPADNPSNRGASLIIAPWTWRV